MKRPRVVGGRVMPTNNDNFLIFNFLVLMVFFFFFFLHGDVYIYHNYWLAFFFSDY